MGRVIIKKVRPTLAAKQLHNYGRQSAMKEVHGSAYDIKAEEKPQQMQEVKETDKKKENKKNTVMMTTEEKIELANAVLADKPAVKAKRMKSDKGLIERKENTIILTEDNRELLKD